MANTDWIENTDADFSLQAVQFNDWVQLNGVTHGLTLEQTSALHLLLGSWEAAYPAHLAAQSAATTAATSKDDTRAPLEAMLRDLGAILQTNPNMTDTKRTEVGITVRSTTRTRAPVPTTRPSIIVDSSKRLQHTLHFKDVTTPNSKAKPAGVLGLEIRGFVGPTPPADPLEYEFVTLDRGTPHLIVYEGADGGKVAHYVSRWENTRGEKGPWSETVSATIGS